MPCHAKDRFVGYRIKNRTPELEKRYNINICIVYKKLFLFMTKEELYKILGHKEIQKDLDVKTLVLDLIREKLSPEDTLNLFLGHLENLDEDFVRGYLYRRV